MSYGYLCVGPLKPGFPVLSFFHKQSQWIAGAELRSKLAGKMISQKRRGNRLLAAQCSDPLPAHRMEMRLLELDVDIRRTDCLNFV